MPALSYVCSTAGCSRLRHARGLCPMHYQRWRKHGDVSMVIRRWTHSLADRFWAKVDKAGDCWLWTAALNRSGYGIFRLNRRARLAHRVAYQLAVGVIPEGSELDHLCRTPACVRPDHLEPVTGAENLCRQGQSVTHCPQGHRYDAENTAIDGSHRKCRTCKRARDRLAYQRRRTERVG